jgi:hypothetical protein
LVRLESAALSFAPYMSAGTGTREARGIRLDSVVAIEATRAYRAFVLPVRYACDVVVGPNGPKIKSEPVLE